MTAFQAIKLLPKDAPSRVALVEAREAASEPTRWHILVYDPQSENGLHEYVVVGGEIVASRALSQFADALTQDDIFGDAAKIDSDRASRLAAEFAAANKIEVKSMNFELKKDGSGASPRWSVTCLDGQGNDVGHLVFSATKGTILSHEGFEKEPSRLDALKGAPIPPHAADPAHIASSSAEKAEKAEHPSEKPPEHNPEKTDRKLADVKKGSPTPPRPEAVHAAPQKSDERVQESDSRSTASESADRRQGETPKTESRRAEQAQQTDPPPKPGFFKRAGGALTKFITGRNPNDRPAPAPVNGPEPPAH